MNTVQLVIRQISKRIWMDLQLRSSIIRKQMAGMKDFRRLTQIHRKSLKLGIMTGIEVEGIHGKYVVEVIPPI